MSGQGAHCGLRGKKCLESHQIGSLLSPYVIWLPNLWSPLPVLPPSSCSNPGSVSSPCGRGWPGRTCWLLPRPCQAYWSETTEFISSSLIHVCKSANHLEEKPTGSYLLSQVPLVCGHISTVSSFMYLPNTWGEVKWNLSNLFFPHKQLLHWQNKSWIPVWQSFVWGPPTKILDVFVRGGIWSTWPEESHSGWITENILCWDLQVTWASTNLLNDKVLKSEI